ncbi:tryptophan--tRNA ligase [Naumannella halotolerans]|uniref:Tryptophan--tRNA ligase n=1 Tax=Naumannella halotolerans TaxID=993414 RepID=A0A4V3ENL6_9ACTN|nr:tryptophan--tRNA ligase [Naumannella halotolerans]TDT34178.1 tryptophanyl-tRNA synthetase [Naumannella halotolerans]
MASERVLSLFQPTGDSFHLGNYLGALRQWASMQGEYETFFGIADLHSLNEQPDPEVLRHRVVRSAAQMIAGGIDPERSVLFLQSAVPEHTQLMWALSCYTGFGQASRMTQFKDKSERRGSETTNVGLFTYPVLMAADILLYQAHKVPVGEDQRQHLELTRDLAVRFNGRYGQTFVVPEPHIVKSVGRIVDLQDPTIKMSKSASSPTGLIELLDEPKVTAKKIRSAVTDSGREIVYDPENKPGVSNLLTIIAALRGTDVAAVAEELAGGGYGDLKKAAAQVVDELVVPFRARTFALLDDPAELQRILARGAERAREVASVTQVDVYRKLGLL